MHIIKINDDEYRLPANWNELTMDQLLYLSRLTKQPDLPVQKLTIYMVFYCLGAHIADDSRVFGRKIKMKLGKESHTVRMAIGQKHYDLDPPMYVQLSSLMDFLIERTETKESAYSRQTNPYIAPVYEYRLRPELTVCPCKKVRASWYTLRHEGDPSLMDITFEQYMYLQTFISGLASGQATIDDVLVCVWHRSKQFSLSHHERDAKLMEQVDDDKKTVMMWFISSCLADFANQFPRLFSGEGSHAGGNVLDSQLRMLDLLADHDVTKKDQIRASALFDVFYSLDEMMREKENMEENMKKNA